MSTRRLPRATLTLLYQFELDPSCRAHGAMRDMDHDAAAKQAAAMSRLCAPPQVVARCRIIDAPLEMATVHALPFDSWCTRNTAAVRLEFVFAASSTTALCARVVTDVSRVDGVAASRILFHTLEVMEGKAVDPQRFKVNPPLRYGWRHVMKALMLLVVTIADLILGAMTYRARLLLSRLTGKPCGRRLGMPSSAAAIMAFYDSPRHEVPIHRMFAPHEIAFNDLIVLIDAWKERLGKNGFFYLLNFGSTISPGMTRHARDLTSLKARYAGVIARPRTPPTGRIWRLLEYSSARKLFFNNYGRHHHNFGMKPVAFGWDWIDLVATLNGCGVITINGHSLCWFRSSRRCLDEHRDLFEKVLGQPVGEFPQATHFPPTTAP